MHRSAMSALIASLFLASGPALAVEENEALVMRIVFEDCLGYLREDREPFLGLETARPSDAALQWLPDYLSGHNVAQLLSPRYVAAWGEDDGTRYCTVQTVWGDEAPLGEPVLGVDSNGFIKRVTARAIAAGLTSYYPGMNFSAIETTYWSEPETGFDFGPGRPVTLTMMPTDGDKNHTLLDAGLIVMGGPPLASPGHRLTQK